MHKFFVLTIEVLLLSICFGKHDSAQDDYSEDGNTESESNEVVTMVRKPDGSLANITEYFEMMKKMKETTTSSSTTSATTQVTTKNKKSFRRRRADEESEEERSTTTLVNYPFSVSVQRKGAHYATGALVDKRWILTTAADFYNVRESLKLFRARLGSVDCKKGGEVIPIKRVEIHPSFVLGQPNFDLSLLRMAQPVEYSDVIKPISLSKVKTKVISAKFMTTYWPRLVVKDKVLPRHAQERIKQNSMRVSTQRLIPKERCNYIMRLKNVSLDETSLCLKPFVTHHSACMPDAGAPIAAEDGLWGITSGWVSKDCKKVPSPTVFSRVSLPSVSSWLDSQIFNAS